MSGNDVVSVTPKYLIGAVTKLTGLSIDVVRVLGRRTRGGDRAHTEARRGSRSFRSRAPQVHRRNSDYGRSNGGTGDFAGRYSVFNARACSGHHSADTSRGGRALRAR